MSAYGRPVRSGLEQSRGVAKLGYTLFIYRLWLALMLVVLFTVTALGRAQAQGQEPDLLVTQAPIFTYQPLRPSLMPPDSGPATIAEYEVALDVWALARSELEPAEFVLPNGSRFLAVPEEIRYRGSWQTDFAWRGHLEGDGEDGWAVITVHQGHIAGRLSFPRRDVIELKPGPEPGVLRMLELHSSFFPGCGAEFLDADGFGYVESSASSPLVTSASTAGAPIIDVMGLYTPLARSLAGGTPQIEAVIQSAVDVTNDAYFNSLVYQRLELVHMDEVSYTGDKTGDPYNIQLNWVRNDSAVAALRNQHQADLVALISGNMAVCGVAYVMRNVDPSFEAAAFSVTLRHCAVGNLTFAHELGHNMGLEHDPDNGPDPAIASFPWSFGHIFQLPDLISWRRTIMAYETSCPGGDCPKINHFSNPNVLYQGVPTGIADQRENARTLNLTSNLVAAFRQGNWLFSDRFEERGFALSGDVGPMPRRSAEACAEMESLLSLMERSIAERAVQLTEDDDEGWSEYERQLGNLTDERDRIAAECKES